MKTKLSAKLKASRCFERASVDRRIASRCCVTSQNTSVSLTFLFCVRIKKAGLPYCPKVFLTRRLSDNFNIQESQDQTVALLNELNLERLSKSVQKSEAHVLNIFFSVKTHKPQCPFRAIVTERDT